MTEEEKQLLLKDLRARLSCGVVVRRTYYTLDIILDDNWAVKPYLRPMSSMTEEEKKKIQALYHENTQNVFKDPDKERGYRFYDISVVDWLNAHHFDYRGLIEKGLALEAPEGMYKNE